VGANEEVVYSDKGPCSKKEYNMLGVKQGPHILMNTLVSHSCMNF